MICNEKFDFFPKSVRGFFKRGHYESMVIQILNEARVETTKADSKSTVTQLLNEATDQTITLPYSNIKSIPQ